jgi:hypothetical protein
LDLEKLEHHFELEERSGSIFVEEGELVDEEGKKKNHLEN